MKKLVFLLSMVLMLSFACFAHAEGFNASFPDGEYIFDVAVLDENTIAVLTDLNLYKVDTQLGFQTKLGSRLEGSVSIYCSTDGGIYSSIPSEQPYDTLYHFNEKTSEWEPFANIPMEMGNEYYGHIIKGVWIDACFYFLEYMDGQPSILASYNTKDQQAASYGTFSANEGNGSLFLTNENVVSYDFDYNKKQAYLFSFDLQTQQIEKKPINPNTPATVSDIAFDAEQQMYWVTSLETHDGTREYVLYSGPSLDELQKVASPVNSSQMLPLTGDCILVESERLMSYHFMKNATESLMLANFHTAYDTKFTAQHGVLISTIGTNVADILTMRNDTIDLIALSTTGATNLKQIKEKQFFVDLSGSAVLTKQSEQLYPGLSNVLWTADHQMAAWILEAQPYMFGVNTALLEQYGLQAPTTLPELLDQMAILIEEGVFESGDYIPFGLVSYQQQDLLSYAVKRYIFEQEIQGKQLNFDNAELKAILTRIINEVPVQDPYPAMTGEEDAVYMLYNVFVPISKYAMQPLKIGPNSPLAIETAAQAVIVNPYSKHKDTAIQYLEYLAEQRGEESYTIYSNMTDPLIDAYVQSMLEEIERKISALQAAEMTEEVASMLQDLEEQREYYAENLYAVDLDDIAAWKASGPAMLVQDETLYTDQINSLINRMVTGGMSVDAFISECNRYIDMVYAERQ